MSAVVIKYGSETYGAERVSEVLPMIQVFANKRYRNHSWLTNQEEEARRWLCDHGLRKSKAKKLLSAALRGEGDFADPAHPARFKS